MRTSLATTISVVGVLAAGAGAFAVNSAVLNVASDSAIATVADVAPTSTIESANNSVIKPSSTPSVQTTTPGNVQPQPAPALQTALQTSATQTSTYKVGDAGRVILEVRDNELRVANVLPATGWSAGRPEYDDGEIEVAFYSGATEVEFKARLVSGEIKVFVETETEEADDSYEREYHEDDHDDDDDHDRDDD